MQTPRVVIEAHLKETLTRSGGRVALCDAEGKTLGLFVPLSLADDAAIVEWAKSQISDEEIQRRLNEPGPRRTTAEVLQRIQALRA
jgi:hypothetical protein